MSRCGKSCEVASRGSFYTVPEHCITCAGPHVAAPDLLGWHEENEEGGTPHCLVRRQPVTAQDLEHALQAMHDSCVSNIRYRGRNLEILRLLESRGLRSQCDFPLRWWNRLRWPWPRK
jgi:hypothetical protein